MTMDQNQKDAKCTLPTSNVTPKSRLRWSTASPRFKAVIALLALALATISLSLTRFGTLGTSGQENYLATVNFHDEICPGIDGRGTSISGFIGLKGDSEESPKRSF